METVITISHWGTPMCVDNHPPCHKHSSVAVTKLPTWDAFSALSTSNYLHVGSSSLASDNFVPPIHMMEQTNDQ